MRDPVIGYHVGQRVTSLRSAISGPSFEAVIETVVVPKKGRRFVVIRDDQGRTHHRWLDEIELIGAAPNGGLAQSSVFKNPAPHSEMTVVPSTRTGTWDDLLAERGVTT